MGKKVKCEVRSNVWSLQHNCELHEGDVAEFDLDQVSPNLIAEGILVPLEQGKKGQLELPLEEEK